jgi:hypothetical protein
MMRGSVKWNTFEGIEGDRVEASCFSNWPLCSMSNTVGQSEESARESPQIFISGGGRLPIRSRADKAGKTAGHHHPSHHDISLLHKVHESIMFHCYTYFSSTCHLQCQSHCSSTSPPRNSITSFTTTRPNGAHKISPPPPRPFRAPVFPRPSFRTINP